MWHTDPLYKHFHKITRSIGQELIGRTMRIIHIVVFLMWVFSLSSPIIAASNGVYKLRSIHRKHLQSTFGDCFSLQVILDKNGSPKDLVFTGHCCFDKKLTEFKAVLTSTQRGLEATFQWSYDTRYYLTAKSIGKPLKLEIKVGPINDEQRFILKSVPKCQDCIAIMSVSTNLYISSSRTGKIKTTNHIKGSDAWFDFYKCKPALLIVCNSLNVVC